MPCSKQLHSMLARIQGFRARFVQCLFIYCMFFIFPVVHTFFINFSNECVKSVFILLQVVARFAFIY